MLSKIDLQVKFRMEVAEVGMRTC